MIVYISLWYWVTQLRAALLTLAIMVLLLQGFAGWRSGSDLGRDDNHLGPQAKASGVVQRLAPGSDDAIGSSRLSLAPRRKALESANPDIVTVSANPETPKPKSIEQIIREAAAEFNIDADLFFAVAKCESSLNPKAFNPKSGASGLFQFIQPTWARNAVRLGYSVEAVFDPVAASRVAALMWSGPNPQAYQWSCWYLVRGLPMPTPRPTPTTR